MIGTLVSRHPACNKSGHSFLQIMGSTACHAQLARIGQANEQSPKVLQQVGLKIEQLQAPYAQ